MIRPMTGKKNTRSDQASLPLTVRFEFKISKMAMRSIIRMIRPTIPPEYESIFLPKGLIFKVLIEI